MAPTPGASRRVSSIPRTSRQRHFFWNDCGPLLRRGRADDVRSAERKSRLAIRSTAPMRIQIDPEQSNPEPKLADPTNFRELAIVVPDATAPGVPDALATIGRLGQDDHVFVDQALLVRLAGPLVDDPEWCQG